MNVQDLANELLDIARNDPDGEVKIVDGRLIVVREDSNGKYEELVM